LILIAIALIGSIAIGSAGIHNAHATTPEVYVTPSLNTGSACDYIIYYVNIKNAPHATTEPAADTDKTWAWEINITWDPDILECPEGYIFEDRDVTAAGYVYAFFGFFETWKWMTIPPPPKWVGTEYGNYFTVTYASASALVGCTMTQDVRTIAVPSGSPQESLHSGANYDLPYTEGLTTTHYPADTLNLFIVYFHVLSDGPPAECPIHIAKATFLDYDLTAYTVTTTDGYFGAEPVPEFPFGVAAEIGLIVAVAYIWWTRRRKLNGVP
jgi:hypothetical protein